MRILHLEASPGWGGQEIRILREAQGMRERGHEVILGVMCGGSLISKARKEGFLVYELDFRRPFWPVTLLRLLWILLRRRIEIVNTHSSLDGWIGGIAARIARRPIVRTRHLSTPIKPGWNSRFLYGRLADYIVTTCSSIIPMICDQSGKKREECRSVATGVDPSRIQSEKKEGDTFRRNLGILPSDFLVGTACFMRSWKGIDDFLKAADLLRQVGDVKWVIIGGGHAETYMARSREMRLDGIVHFTGHLENPFSALTSLDLFALLSTAHEGISQAMLQAAFLGKCLLATPTGGLCEVCVDQKTGVQVPPSSPREVAQAVIRMKENPSLREEMGQRARQLVEKYFLLGHTLDQMEEVYGRILKK